MFTDRKTYTQNHKRSKRKQQADGMLKRLSKERQCRVDINDSHEKADDTLLDRCVIYALESFHLFTFTSKKGSFKHFSRCSVGM